MTENEIHTIITIPKDKQMKKLLLLALITLPLFAKDIKIGKELKLLSADLTAELGDEYKGKKLAVVPFSEKSEIVAGYSGGVTAYLHIPLQKRKLFDLIDREEITKVIEEINFAQSSLADQSRVQELGKMLSADYICTGSLSETFGSVMIIAKIIKTETTEIISSGSIEISLDKMKGLKK